MRAELKPEEKVAAIRSLTRAGQRVAMVGDGVNDAPSLAAAHIGVAMGARGSDAALEQADVVLMHDRLENFLAAFRLSQRARRIIRQNLVISLGTVVVLVTFAHAGQDSADRRRGRPRRQHGDRGDEQPATALWRRPAGKASSQAAGIIRGLIRSAARRDGPPGLIRMRKRYSGEPRRGEPAAVDVMLAQEVGHLAPDGTAGWASGRNPVGIQARHTILASTAAFLPEAGACVQ